MMEIQNFQIPAVHSETEVSQIVGAVRAVPGVTKVTGDRATKIFIVEWNDPATWDDIKHTIEHIGYTPQNNEGF